MRISDWSSDVCSSDLARSRLAVDGDRPAAESNGLVGVGVTWDSPFDRPNLALARLPKGGLQRVLLVLHFRAQYGQQVIAERHFVGALRHYRQPLRQCLLLGRIAPLHDIIILHAVDARSVPPRSEEHTSELQSLMRISYAVFCLKKKKTQKQK